MISPIINLYKNAYSGLTHKIWLLSAVMLINRAGTMVLAFMTLYINHLGFTINEGGVVVAIYGLGSVAGAFLGGRISDRFGFYYTQFCALLFGGIMFIVLGQMRSYISICICTFILSMVNESFRPANASAIAHYSTPENRTQSFSLIRLAINLGWAVGSALGGFLASVNYQYLFWVDGLTNIAGSFMLLNILPVVTRAQQHKTVTEALTEKDPAPYRDKQFLYFLLFTLIFAACFFQFFTTIPIFFKEGLGLSEFKIGLVMAGNGLVIALLEMVLVFKIEGRRPYPLLMSYGCYLMAFAFLILNLPLSNGFLIAGAAMLVITVGEMISMPFMNSYYISRSNERTRGQYAGMYTMAWSAAQVIGSSAGAFLAYKFGFFSLWVFVAVLCVIAGMGFYRLNFRSPLAMRP